MGRFAKSKRDEAGAIWKSEGRDRIETATTSKAAAADENGGSSEVAPLPETLHHLEQGGPKPRCLIK